MIRRTVSIPESVDALVRDLTKDGESYSAALARLVEEGARALETPRRLSFIGSGEGPGDLGENAEKYLEEIFAEWED
jgi:hypothetical protein